MNIEGLLSALVVGVVIGALGRLVVPGRQRIGILLTVVVGIVAAVVGGELAEALLDTDSRLVLVAIQVLLAAIGVAVVAAVTGRDARR